MFETLILKQKWNGNTNVKIFLRLYLVILMSSIRKKEWRGFSDWLGTNNVRGQLRKYKVNDNFFKKWSKDMSYVLGFWWADGYIRIRNRKGKYDDGYGFGICQNSKDGYILKKILDKMDSNNPICCPQSRLNMSHFEIFSKTIFCDIIKLGGLPNKSLAIRMPKIPSKYFADFVRGLFDGDGSISVDGICPSSYICSGSVLFINDLKEVLQEYGINSKIATNGNNKTPCYLLRFSANDSRKLGRLMYYDKDIIRLERKFNKFMLARSWSYGI